METMNYYYGYDAGWGPGYERYRGVGYSMGNIATETYLHRYEESTVVLDIANFRTRPWRKSTSPKVRKREINA